MRVGNVSTKRRAETGGTSAAAVSEARRRAGAPLASIPVGNHGDNLQSTPIGQSGAGMVSMFLGRRSSGGLTA